MGHPSGGPWGSLKKRNSCGGRNEKISTRKQLNKTQTTICRWEIGQNVPNVQNILKLEEFLGSLPKPPNRGRDTFDILPIIRSFEGVKLKSITPIQFKQIIDICRPLQNPVSKLLLQELIENITTSDKSS